MVSTFDIYSGTVLFYPGAGGYQIAYSLKPTLVPTIINKGRTAMGYAFVF
jgi:hypothetical protein